jgi:hypothetical protein
LIAVGTAIRTTKATWSITAKSTTEKMTMNTHELKTDPRAFAASLAGDKTYEIRLDDRSFSPGDMLVLRETKYSGVEMAAHGMPLSYTGRVLSRIVTHKLHGYGLQEGWVVLGVQNI